MGSCFADSIGDKLSENKFDALVNPFGVIFHPLAQFKLIQQVINNSPPDKDSIVKSQGIFYHYDLHSKFSAFSPEELELKIKAAVSGVHSYLKKAAFLFLTFGTAVGYRRIDNQKLVANCHKIPSTEFIKEMVPPSVIDEEFQNLLKALLKFNPDVKVIITVSPVRHLKEGLETNSISKAVLRLAADSITATRKGTLHYFPAYEILLDDLRDYRFYASDMLHPSTVAEDYIWGQFKNVFMDSPTHAIIERWSSIRKSIEHLPFNPDSKAYTAFLTNTLQELKDISEILDVDKEIHGIEEKLKSASQ